MQKTSTIGSAGSRNRFATPFSLGITMGANEYPCGVFTLTNIQSGGAYWYNATSTMQHTETFYLCDSEGNNKIQLFTLSIPAGQSDSNIGKTATISATDGKKLKGKAIYLIATNSSYPGYSYIGLANQTGVALDYVYDSFSITASAGNGGTATANVNTATPGTTITITCSPRTGYKANTPTATGISFVSAGTNKWTFTMPSSNVTVSCTFSKIAYTITKSASPAAGGSVTVAGSANAGDEVSISQTTNSGYYFNGWTTRPALTISGGKFTMPASNVTITANYLKYSTASVSSNSMTSGSSITLNIVSDRASYTHKYKLSFGTNMETSLTNVAAGVINVNIPIPDSWANQIPNASQKTGGTLIVETYNGATKIGTYTISGLTFNVRSTAVPSIGTITNSIIRTVGGTTYANVGNYYVQNKSAVRTQASASGSLGSTIASIQLTMSGYTANAYKTTVNAASIDFTSGLLTVSGTCTITLKATDSRGRTATKTATISVAAYNAPSGTLKVWRVDNNGDADPLGTYAKYELTKTYTQIGSNTFSWSIVSQSTTASSPANTGDLLPGNRQTFSATSEYIIRLNLTDSFGTVQIQVTLPTARFLLYCNAAGDRIGIMTATNENLSKNGKETVIQFPDNAQIYIGSQKIEDVFALKSLMQSQTFKYSQYASGATYNVTLPKTPVNNSTFLLITRHYTSNTSWVVDLHMLCIVNSTPYLVQIVKNSSATYSSVSISGDVLTITFSSTVYAQISTISLTTS